MTNQIFTDADFDQVMANPAVTVLSGWTEPNNDAPCNEEAYRQQLAKNHAGYSVKIKEALESATYSTTTAR